MKTTNTIQNFARQTILVIFVIVSTSKVWGATATTTFTSAAWADANNGWTSNTNGSSFETRGVASNGVDGECTSKTSYSGVYAIELVASSNAGSNSIKISIGSTEIATKAIANANNVTYVYDYRDYANIAQLSGTINIKVNHVGSTTWVKSITIRYATAAYTVSFNAGTGSCAADPMTESGAGYGVTLPSASPSASCSEEGWTFAGWKPGSAQAETTMLPDLYAAGESYHPESDETLYAVYQLGDCYTINFESAAVSYSDWTFTNMSSQQRSSIVAHRGDYYGTTGGTATASIATTSSISSPKQLRFYVSKQTTNTSTSYWRIQTSDNGSVWTTRLSQDAKEMSQGTWVEVSYDLSSYSDVYIRIYYDGQGSTATRNIDDVVLSCATYNSNPICCDKNVNLTAGTQTNATINSFSPTRVATCSAIDADRSVTITVNAATGYEFTSSARLTYTGDGTASYESGPMGEGPTYTFVYQFAQNDNGDGVFSVTSATPKVFTITYKDQGGGDFTGTQTDPPTTHTYGTATTLRTPTKDGYAFQGWYTVSDCSSGGVGESLGATAYTSDITLYAKWDLSGLRNYRTLCEDFEFTGPLGDLVFITSSASKQVRSQEAFHVEGSALSKSAALSFSFGSASLNNKFSFKTATGGTVSTDGDGNINTDIYVFYTPDAGDTDDGLDIATNLTATVGYTKASITDKTVIGRHLPANFVIATKRNDGSWYVLPADMESTSHPSPVLIAVDNNDNPSTAYVTSDNYIYTLNAQTASVVSAGNGQYVKLAMHGQSDAPLFGSATGASTLGKSGGAIVTNDLSAGWWWKLTQTNTSVSTAANAKYTIYCANNTQSLKLWENSGSPQWGFYASDYEEMRLVPATIISPLSINIMEWGADEIAIQYTGNGTFTSASVACSVAGSASMSRVGTTGSDIWKISNLTGLASNPGGTLIIKITESAILKYATIQIPFIITSASPSKSDTELRNLLSGTDTQKKNIAKTMDVIVCANCTLTTSTQTGAFNNLYLYPGGKADISKDITFQNVYLRGGYSWLGGSYALPQMNVASGKSISGIEATGNGVFYDLYLDNAMYYMFALPKTVAVTAITNEENGDDWDAWIKSYSGEGRTLSTKVSGWSYVTSGNIERGAGYEIAIKPRLSRPYGILRFPLLKNTAWTDETACSPSITGWGVNDANVTANNKGWNIIGNPYMTAYNNAALPGTTPSGKIQTQTLVQHKPDGVNWDGTYEWSTTDVKYFTIPKYTDYDYEDVRAFPYKLDAFYPFFIQVTGDGTVSFTASNKTLKAPKRTLQKTEREVIVDFVLTNANDETDVAGLSISNEYAEGFDADDKEKTILGGLAYMKVYTLVGEYRTAFNSLPEAAAALPIPVGYIAPKKETYRFSLLDGGDYSEVEHVWLQDKVDHITVDLMTEDAYAFESEIGEFQERFTINVILKDEENTATGVNNVDNEYEPPMKFIYQDKLYILRGGVIYDATGRRVSEINK